MGLMAFETFSIIDKSQILVMCMFMGGGGGGGTLANSLSIIFHNIKHDNFSVYVVVCC